MNKDNNGFTLVEIIVVIVIMAVLAAIAIPSVLSYINDANHAKYLAEARSVYLTAMVEEEIIAMDANEDVKYRYKNDEDDFVATMISNINQRLHNIDIKVQELAYYEDGTTIAGHPIPQNSYVFDFINQDDQEISALVEVNKEIEILSYATSSN